MDSFKCSAEVGDGFYQNPDHLKTQKDINQNILLKQPIRVKYLIKLKPLGALAGKQEHIETVGNLAEFN